MNCCSKSGIREHSPNTHIHFQIFQRIAKLFSVDFPDHGEDGFRLVRCVQRYLEVEVPCRFCILSTFPVNRRTDSVCNGLHPSFIILGNTFSFCSIKSQPQDCRNLLNSLLLGAMGLSAAFPSTRQNMHPLVALETSTLRRMILVQYSSCCRVPQSYRHPRTFRSNRTRCEGKTCRNEKIYVHHCRSRLGLNSFFLLLYPFCHCGAAYQAEILGAASGTEMPNVEQMKEIVPLITCEITFGQNVCDFKFGVNVSNLNLKLKINPVKQPIQSNSAKS